MTQKRQKRLIINTVVCAALVAVPALAQTSDQPSPGGTASTPMTTDRTGDRNDEHHDYGWLGLLGLAGLIGLRRHSRAANLTDSRRP
jgi:hypothetical protein